MTKAYAYMRCSGDGQSLGDTWDRQKQTIREYANTHGYEIVKEFQDEGVPGKTELAHRPGLAALMSAAAANGVRVVLVEIPDRLARNLITNELIIQEFQEMGVRVISASGGIDLTEGDDSNPTSKLVRQILAAIAEFDRHLIVRKTRAARDRLRAKNGKCEGRHAYGTKPGEEWVLTDIKHMSKAGYGARKIARILNQDGKLTRYKKPWTGSTVWRILKRTGDSCTPSA